MERNDQPAFPGKLPLTDTQGQEAADFAFFSGMTLRDYFAAKALAVVYKPPADSTKDEAAFALTRAATKAYLLADAMLAARVR